MGNIPFVTIFTPTYNRVHTLIDLYQSLKEQSDMNFEWIVVDDGSTDDTEKFFNDIVRDDSSFSIIYKRQTNQGKHVAINSGVQIAHGKFFLIVDSDDTLTADAIETVVTWAMDLPKEGYAGLAFLKASKEEKDMWGNTFEGEYKDFTSLERRKNRVSGDKAEVYYTDILRRFPFPQFEGERFITEALVWNRIAAANLKLRWVNEIIYLADYLEDGLTQKINQLFLDNFRGYTEYIKELIQYPQTTFFEKIRAIGMYTIRGVQKNKSIQLLAENIEMPFYITLFAYLCAKIMGK